MGEYKYYIGIDCGVKTGIAVWDKINKKLILIETVPIHKAMDIVRESITKGIKVRVEDARLRTWFGKADREQLQGAGSIKRDSKIWEDFLKDLGIDYDLVAPKNNKTKLNADIFNKITGWVGITSVHGRDAAMLVYKL